MWNKTKTERNHAQKIHRNPSFALRSCPNLIFVSVEIWSSSNGPVGKYTIRGSCMILWVSYSEMSRRKLLDHRSGRTQEILTTILKFCWELFNKIALEKKKPWTHLSHEKKIILSMILVVFHPPQKKPGPTRGPFFLAHLDCFLWFLKQRSPEFT